RQISHVMKPDFAAERLLVVEVLTPAGNWSSYPPHKHDEDDPPGEVVLEEVYYYRTASPEAFAFQRLYSPRRDVDVAATVRHGDLMLVPWGYHTTCAAHGYDLYYLNALAGDRRSMAAADDPDLAWIRKAWADLEPDPRVPLVT
ncbi:MAG: 5-deoxy-glucuronate isomerase, partial [Candidatus Rokuibacteriota bacterium]